MKILATSDLHGHLNGFMRLVEQHTPEIVVLAGDITDTGCGISQKKLDRLFDPFVQDIASRMYENAGEMKGTGLGLPIVKRMIDGAQGVIDVKSTLGEGTNFHIEIPGLAVIDHMSTVPRAAEETIRAVMPEAEGLAGAGDDVLEFSPEEDGILEFIPE